jgi:hypothetical protein
MVDGRSWDIDFTEYPTAEFGAVAHLTKGAYYEGTDKRVYQKALDVTDWIDDDGGDIDEAMAKTGIPGSTSPISVLAGLYIGWFVGGWG